VPVWLVRPPVICQEKRPSTEISLIASNFEEEELSVGQTGKGFLMMATPRGTSSGYLERRRYG